MDAQAVIWNALRGALVTRALGLAADLRVAQALVAGPRSHEELARERGVDATCFAATSGLRSGSK
jgi:hypothetical protein